jgi:hypothetical protein
MGVRVSRHQLRAAINGESCSQDRPRSTDEAGPRPKRKTARSRTLESEVQPIRNPVTGAEHRIQVVMPEGFEHIEGEVASSDIRSTEAIRFETRQSHSTLAHVVQTPRGVAA